MSEPRHLIKHYRRMGLENERRERIRERIWKQRRPSFSTHGVKPRQKDILRKTVLAVLMGGCFACFGWDAWIGMSYFAYMPHSPQPETGRIYRVEVMHGSVRYVTKSEFARKSGTENVGYIALGFFAAAAFVDHYWKPRED